MDTKRKHPAFPLFSLFAALAPLGYCPITFTTFTRVRATGMEKDIPALPLFFALVLVVATAFFAAALLSRRLALPDLSAYLVTLAALLNGVTVLYCYDKIIAA